MPSNNNRTYWFEEEEEKQEERNKKDRNIFNVCLFIFLKNIKRFSELKVIFLLLILNINKIKKDH